MERNKKSINIIIIEDSDVLLCTLINEIEAWARLSSVTVNEVHYDSLPEITIFFKYPVCDLLIIDISYFRQKGIDFCKKLRQNTFSGLIAFTADNAALVFNGYEAGASGFYINPVSQKQISHILNRLISGNENPFFYIKAGTKTEKIPFSDIMFITKSNHYSIFYTVNGSIHTREKISNIEFMLPPFFQRCNRSTIVNIHYILTMNDSVLYLKNRVNTKVSKQYINIIKSKMQSPYFED